MNKQSLISETLEVLPIIVLKLMFAATIVFVPLYVIVTVSKFFSYESIFMKNRKLDITISVVTTLLSIAIAFFAASEMKKDVEERSKYKEDYKQWCLDGGGWYSKYNQLCQVAPLTK
jgi:hypothetical protein